jgi:hypothetical protein
MAGLLRLFVQVRLFPECLSLCASFFVTTMILLLPNPTRNTERSHLVETSSTCRSSYRSLWRCATLMLSALRSPGLFEPLLLQQDAVSRSRLNNSRAQLGIQLLFHRCREMLVPSVRESFELVTTRNTVVNATNHSISSALTNDLGRIVRVMLAANYYASSPM